MTTLAAIQGPSWVVVGYDSQVSDDGRSYLLPADSPKCFEVGEYLIGIAGDYRAVNVLSHNFVPPDPGKNSGVDLDKFMNSKFVPSLKKCFDNNFYGKENEHGSLLLVVVNCTVYEIGDNYDCIRDSRGLYALGSGGAFALGALYALDEIEARNQRNAERHIEIAMNAAASLDPATSDPVFVVKIK